jgi:hypothetical protein
MVNDELVFEAINGIEANAEAKFFEVLGRWGTAKEELLSVADALRIQPSAYLQGIEVLDKLAEQEGLALLSHYSCAERCGQDGDPDYIYYYGLD